MEEREFCNYCGAELTEYELKRFGSCCVNCNNDMEYCDDLEDE